MGPLAEIAVGVAAFGTSLATPPPPPALTETQRTMYEAGMFEADSFREPAFEALVENIRSWHEDMSDSRAVDLNRGKLGWFGEYVEKRPAANVRASGEVMMVDPVGDAFPGVSRLTLRIVDQGVQHALLVFAVDQPAPEIGSRVEAHGRAYKMMMLPTQTRGAPSPFPAMVGRYTEVEDVRSATGPAVIIALTGALTVAFLIVVMGRYAMDRQRAQRRLAAADDPGDDRGDA